MAEYCCNNNMLEVVDDDVHRLLPLEIIKDIGIANADKLRRIAILQELSSRLATVLGDAKEGSQDHRRLYPASWATNSYQHHHGPPQPQVYREVDSRGRIADGHVVNAQRAHAPSSFWNARMVDTGISLPRFAPARLRQADVVPPAKQAASKGTGVFLPRVQAYPDTTSGARTGGGGGDMKPRRRRGKEQFRQQQRQQLRLHAQAVAGAPAELQARWRWRSDAHADAASNGCHDDELGLPQEWIY